MTRAEYAAQTAKDIRQVALAIVNRTSEVSPDWHRVAGDFTRIGAKAKNAGIVLRPDGVEAEVLP